MKLILFVLKICVNFDLLNEQASIVIGIRAGQSFYCSACHLSEILINTAH